MRSKKSTRVSESLLAGVATFTVLGLYDMAAHGPLFTLRAVTVLVVASFITAWLVAILAE